MSEMAKQARAAMKAKASKLTTADPHQKVDSSTWTPDAPINAEVKTGMRPVSRRAFKTGGKVQGVKAKANMGRKPRQSGGKALTADSLINRNVKEADAQRPGGKAHIGGMKKGGAAKCKTFAKGGYSPASDFHDEDAVPNPSRKPDVVKKPEDADISPAMAARMQGIMDSDAATDRAYEQNKIDRKAFDVRGYKKGGKTKKAMGGPMNGPMAGSQQMMQNAQNVAGVPASILDSTPAHSRFSKGLGLKKGGAAKHDDVKQDMALIKKMVKPSARKGRDAGGANLSAEDRAAIRANVAGTNRQAMEEAGGSEKVYGSDEGLQNYLNTTRRIDQFKRDAGQADLKRGGKAKRTARKEGGGVFTGTSYPGKIPGVVPGGREARATGGKTKGKTNINIVIAGGHKQPNQSMMGPPPGMDAPPGGLPIPVPPASGAGPMPMPMPVAGPAPMPAPMPGPAPRKSGGRLTKVAHSYKDMEAGAGSGEGRLQKTDIAAYKASRKEGGKVGHRTYRSYKDMDAGAGSGFGRLEKTEIQKHKR